MKGDGISFELSEISGKLKAFEKKHVVITVYSDMWGSYVDNIVCNIEGLSLVFIVFYIIYSI